jgi:hypothetical protein
MKLNEIETYHLQLIRGGIFGEENSLLAKGLPDDVDHVDFFKLFAQKGDQCRLFIFRCFIESYRVPFIDTLIQYNPYMYHSLLNSDFWIHAFQTLWDNCSDEYDRLFILEKYLQEMKCETLLDRIMDLYLIKDGDKPLGEILNNVKLSATLISEQVNRFHEIKRAKKRKHKKAM